MAEMGCHGCEAIIEDTELFCPHCGTPTIPQKTRTELQIMMNKDQEKRSRWMWRLRLLGALFGFALTGLLWLLVEPSNPFPTWLLPTLLANVLLFSFMGGLIGLICDAVRKR